MKIFPIILLFLIVAIKNEIDPSKIFIIYFTRTGNTELFANYIKEKVNCGSYKIVPDIAYPEDYNTMLNLAKEERNNNIKPKIKNPLTQTDISKYDIILLGYPIWHSYLPNIVINQLEQLNLSGKIIYPFNTHGGSGIANSITDIKKAASGATVKGGFEISSSNIQNKEKSMEKIEKWLNNRVQNPDDNSEGDGEDKENNFKMIKLNYFLYLLLIILI